MINILNAGDLSTSTQAALDSACCTRQCAY